MSAPIPLAHHRLVALTPHRAAPGSAPERYNLTALRDTMNLASQTVLEARLSHANPLELRAARQAHLLAMTRYEDALATCRLPTPRRLHQEIRLLRRLLG